MGESIPKTDHVVAIAPAYTAADWKALDLSSPDSPGWQRAVDIFLNRVEGRFLIPVRSLRDHIDKGVAEFSGFAMVAIDCLLIETLGQFYKGIDETPSGKNKHRQHFIDFFQQSRHFAPHFDAETGGIFYSHFRCGVLHQAQTKGRSKVRYGETSMVQFVDPANARAGLIVDRNRLHEALEAEIRDYASRLRASSPAGEGTLRGKFKYKMGLIADDPD